MYRPVLDPAGGSLALSALFAMLPLLTLFILLGVLRLSAWKAALISLLVALLVAVLVYPMPVGQALLAGTEGAAFGFFPILWIVINAIWVYNMTVVTGHFDVLRRSFARVSDDQRIQAVIIAFCFGALLEALAGFGTPVAITSVMLIALGFRPIKAATVALVANTAPVAFGALAVPITTLATVTGIPEHTLAQMVGRQTPLLGVFVPMALVFIIDRWRGVRADPAGDAGVRHRLRARAVRHLQLPVHAADRHRRLARRCRRGRAAAARLAPRAPLRRDETPTSSSRPERCQPAAPRTVWPPRTWPDADRRAVGPRARSDHPVGMGTGTADELGARDVAEHDSRGDVVRAYAPYLIIIAIFIITQVPGRQGPVRGPDQGAAVAGPATCRRPGASPRPSRRSSSTGSPPRARC